MKFDMCFKNIENILFNGLIFKICNNVNLFSDSCSLVHNLICSQTLFLKFGLFDNVLSPYKIFKKKVHENFNLTKILNEM